MWISISKGNSFVDDPCERCGSKRRISKTWTETHDMFNGEKKTVDCSQIVCTNTDCQATFEEKNIAEVEKREKQKQVKLKNDEIRKTNAINHRLKQS